MSIAEKLSEALGWYDDPDALARIRELLDEPREPGTIRIFTSNDCEPPRTAIDMQTVEGKMGLEGWMAGIEWAHDNWSWAVLGDDEIELEHPEPPGRAEAIWAEVLHTLNTEGGTGITFASEAHEAFREALRRFEGCQVCIEGRDWLIGVVDDGGVYVTDPGDGVESRLFSWLELEAVHIY